MAKPIGDPLVRIMQNVARNGECLEWQLVRNEHGYGIIRYRGKNWRAHRLTWELLHGPIGAGLDLCHKCDNPACIDPAHLFVGTRKDNMRDCASKGRWRNQCAGRAHCKNGHAFDGANTVMRGGTRLCRACARERMARHRARRAA